MQDLLRIPFTLLSLLLAILFSIPNNALGADAVEEAINHAKDLVSPTPDSALDTAGATQPEPDLQAQYPGIENMHIERGGDGTPSVSIYYPRVGNAEVDAKLKDFAESMANAYEQELRESYEDSEDKPDSYGTWEETGFFTAERPNPDVISITFNIYTYSGGAHGQLLVHVQNYDLKSGKLLTFDDLFADPQKALSLLSELSATKLRSVLGDDVEEDMLKEGTAPESANFANISLLANGIAVEFQPYQVGPWSIGQQHVELSLEELAPAGPSPLVWPKKPEDPEK